MKNIPTENEMKNLRLRNEMIELAKEKGLKICPYKPFYIDEEIEHFEFCNLCYMAKENLILIPVCSANVPFWMLPAPLTKEEALAIRKAEEKHSFESSTEAFELLLNKAHEDGVIDDEKLEQGITALDIVKQDSTMESNNCDNCTYCRGGDGPCKYDSQKSSPKRTCEHCGYCRGGDGPCKHDISASRARTP